MRKCECTYNVVKEKYVCTIFTVLINIQVYSELNVFQDLVAEYTGFIFKRKSFFKKRAIIVA